MNKLNKKVLIAILVALVLMTAVTGYYAYKLREEFLNSNLNEYNEAFSNVVEYVNKIEKCLAKATISKSANYSAETLTKIWDNSNLAMAYLSRIPINDDGLSQTAKFLNQVSDYSYSLSKKNINGKKLSDQDMKNLEDLHKYSVDLENTLNQLSADMNEGRISWGELTKKGTEVFEKQVSNISKDSFSNLEENFHEYSGLIYDGAFSEHITNKEKKGLTGENINEEKAKEIAMDFIGTDRIEGITSNGKSENGNIISYDFYAKLKNEERNIAISVSEKGGHIVYMNSDRNVYAESISQEEADAKGKEFLNQKGFYNMKETYYLKQDGIVTINYAYKQDDVVIYSDLIKIKVALDNGEILGIETTGYLNSHTERKLGEIKVSKEKAAENLNKKLEIKSESLAMIPTEWKTEILCWEFKGTINGMDFLVYVNVETGKEEDILLIVNTPNGTLTH